MWSSLNEQVYEGRMDQFAEEEIKTHTRKVGKRSPRGDPELHSIVKKATTSSLQGQWRMTRWSSVQVD